MLLYFVMLYEKCPAWFQSASGESKIIPVDISVLYSKILDNGTKMFVKDVNDFKIYGAY